MCTPLETNNDNKLTILNDTLSQVKDWLQWAELKHGILIAINSTMIFGWMDIIKGATSKYNLLGVFHVFAYISIALMCFAIIVSLVSIIPFLGNNSQHLTKDNNIKMRDGKTTKNILYGGTIDAEDNQQYLNEFISCPDFPAIIAHEIVINAQIGKRKYKYFTITLCLSFIAYIFSFVAAFIYFFIL